MNEEVILMENKAVIFSEDEKSLKGYCRAKDLKNKGISKMIEKAKKIKEC
jgi:hypothetical protein